MMKRSGLKSGKLRSQSALEYLMLHAWAFLIIGIVFAVLISIGLFSQGFSPRAQPGSCSIIRPLGPGTITAISTQGLCSGQLPKFVTVFNGNSWININSTGVFNSINFTVSFWMQYYNGQAQSGVVDKGRNYPNVKDWYFETASSLSNIGVRFDSGVPSGTANSNPSSWNDQSWHFVVGTFTSTSNTASLYIDGTLYNSLITNIHVPQASNIVIGARSPDFGNPYSGSVADVQLYNTTLSATKVQQLYIEGIGGSPIDLYHIAGWWPLNGDALDYSGNNNNGQTSGGLSYSSSWYNNYKIP